MDRLPLCRAAVWGLIGLVCAALPAAAGSTAPDAELPVLNEGCYWRYHFTYAPLMVDAERLKSEGLKCLGEREYNRLKAAVVRRHRRQGRKLADWTADVRAGVGPWSFDGRADAVMTHFRTDPPPPDWTDPGFDDTDWLRQRVCYLVGDFFRYPSAQQVRRVCLRTRFHVPDPAKVEGMTLSVTYRGGCRAFINGTEIARGHLPAGELSRDVRAAPYPPEAYMLRDGEYLPEDYQGSGYYAQYWKRFGGKIVLVTELPAFEDLKPRPGVLPKSKRKDWKEFRYHHGYGLNRAAYDRLVALRDRRLSATIRPAQLRAGTNLLAVEILSSEAHPLSAVWYQAWLRNSAWYHAALLRLELRATGGGVPTALRRPAGGNAPAVQVWAEDIHRRVYAPDFHEPRDAARPARIIAARNGTFAAQIVVGTDRELTGLAVSAGKLLPVGEGMPPQPLPGPAVLYAVPHAMKELTAGDRGRRKGNWPGFDFPQVLRARYGSEDVPYFDHLTTAPPRTVPADSARAAWVSLRVPPGAAPGPYRGTVTVAADGVETRRLPLEVEVLDWAVPDPKDFQAVAGIEQSPYAVATRYNVPVWSREHFELLEHTFRHLGKVGGDWLNVPVLANTEFGNREDSPIRWLRLKDGRLAADFSIADQYIDLAARHCGVPRVINFIVMHPSRPGAEASSPMDLPVIDEADGKRSLMAVDARMPDRRRREFWKHLSTTIWRHMKSRGLDRSVHWGHTWDGPGGDPGLYDLLAEFVPDVGWTKGCHAWGVNAHYKAFATVYNSQVAVGAASKKGWKRKQLWLAYPRYWGTVIDCSDYSTPFSYRLMMDRAIVAGARGIGRVGADYWGRTYLDGMRGQHYAVGVPNLVLLYPGPRGAETGIRFEVLREGLQEVEARIFLEQAMEKLPDEEHRRLKRRVADILDRHNIETLLDPPVASRYQLAEACALNWQRRSRRLYAAAADVAAVIGVDLDKTELPAAVPARGSAAVSIKLRNWTPAPRRWEIAASREWIRPQKSAGSMPPGQENLRVTLDGSGLPPGKPAEGTMTFTDVATGRSETVAVKVAVGEVLAVRGPAMVFNVAPGGAGELPLTVSNPSGAALSWSAGATVGWLTASPPAGNLPPGSQCAVALRAAPPDPGSARHEAALTIAEPGGARKELPVVVHVVPAYRRPPARPGGTGVSLEKLPKGALKAYSDSRGRRGPIFWKPNPHRPGEKLSLGGERKVFAGGLIAPLGHEAVYDLTASPFRAFAAEVGCVSALSEPAQLSWARGLRVHFEVLVDGQVRAQSGLMGPTDSPRLLVVNDLAGGKRLRLRARAGNDQAVKRACACWAEPMLYKR